MDNIKKVIIFIFAFLFLLPQNCFSWDEESAIEKRKIADEQMELYLLKNSSKFFEMAKENPESSFVYAFSEVKDLDQIPEFVISYITEQLRKDRLDEYTAWNISAAIYMLIEYQISFKNFLSTDMAELKKFFSGRYKSVPFYDAEFMGSHICSLYLRKDTHNGHNFYIWSKRLSDQVSPLIEEVTSSPPEDKRLLAITEKSKKIFGDYSINYTWEVAIKEWAKIEKDWNLLSALLEKRCAPTAIKKEEIDGIKALNKFFENAKIYHKVTDEFIRLFIFDIPLYYYDWNTTFEIKYARRELFFDDKNMAYKSGLQYAKLTPFRIYLVRDVTIRNMSYTDSEIKSALGDKRYEQLLKDSRMMPDWYKNLPALTEDARYKN